jgi:hypothetical protein
VAASARGEGGDDGCTVSAAAWGGSLRVATAVVAALGEEGSDDCLGLASLAHWSRALPRESRGGEPVQVEGTKLIIVAPWLSPMEGSCF